MSRAVTFGSTTLVVPHIRGWRVNNIANEVPTSVWVANFQHPFTEPGDHSETLRLAFQGSTDVLLWPEQGVGQ